MHILLRTQISTWWQYCVQRMQDCSHTRDYFTRASHIHFLPFGSHRGHAHFQLLRVLRRYALLSHLTSQWLKWHITQLMRKIRIYMIGMPLALHRFSSEIMNYSHHKITNLWRYAQHHVCTADPNTWRRVDCNLTMRRNNCSKSWLKFD